MPLNLYDAEGHRRYLTAEERAAFLKAAEDAPREVRTFCGTLLYTGCRISEALALTAGRVDLKDRGIIFESLKKMHTRHLPAGAGAARFPRHLEPRAQHRVGAKAGAAVSTCGSGAARPLGAAWAK